MTAMGSLLLVLLLGAGFLGLLTWAVIWFSRRLHPAPATVFNGQLIAVMLRIDPQAYWSSDQSPLRASVVLRDPASGTERIIASGEAYALPGVVRDQVFARVAFTSPLQPRLRLGEPEQQRAMSLARGPGYRFELLYPLPAQASWDAQGYEYWNLLPPGARRL